MTDQVEVPTVGDASDRRSIDDFAEKLERRAARARAAAQTERASETHLDDVLGNRGYYCLHDCRWPGSKVANIDHVVIGPTGIWVVDDKRLTGKVTVNRKGEVWTGRYPFAPTLAKLKAQAEAVQAAIPSCPTVQPIASIHQAKVPNGKHRADGVWLADAGWEMTSVVLAGPQVLTDATIRGLADAAIAALEPTSRTAPQEAVEHLVVPPPRAPAPYRRVGEPRVQQVRTPSFSPPASTGARSSGLWAFLTRERSLRWPRRPLVRALLVLACLWGVGALAGPIIDAARASRAGEERVATAASLPLGATFECRTPGSGWTEVIRWDPLPGAIVAAEWAPAPEGPWTQLPLADDSAERAGVAAAETSLARVRYATGPGTERQLMVTASAPIAPC